MTIGWSLLKSVAAEYLITIDSNFQSSNHQKCSKGLQLASFFFFNTAPFFTPPKKNTWEPKRKRRFARALSTKRRNTREAPGNEGWKRLPHDTTLPGFNKDIGPSFIGSKRHSKPHVFSGFHESHESSWFFQKIGDPNSNVKGDNPIYWGSLFGKPSFFSIKNWVGTKSRRTPKIVARAIGYSGFFSGSV